MTSAGRLSYRMGLLSTQIECAFCGQHHEASQEWEGVPISICPNLPFGWIAMGPDANGDLIIKDHNA